MTREELSAGRCRSVGVALPLLIRAAASFRRANLTP